MHSHRGNRDSYMKYFKRFYNIVENDYLYQKDNGEES